MYGNLMASSEGSWSSQSIPQDFMIALLSFCLTVCGMYTYTTNLYLKVKARIYS